VSLETPVVAQPVTNLPALDITCWIIAVFTPFNYLFRSWVRLIHSLITCYI